MEYDRALFRVYERIMEDLNASPSPLALTSSPTAASSRNAAFTADNNGAIDASTPSRSSRGDGLRRRGRVQTASENGGSNELNGVGEQPDDENEPDDGPDSDHPALDNDNDRRRRRRQQRQAPRQMPTLARRQFSSSMQQQRRHEPIPFILPIWMARKLDRMNVSIEDSGRLSVMRTMMDSSSNSGLMGQFWNILRHRLPAGFFRGSVQHTSYDSVARSQQPFSPGDDTSSSNHRDDDSLAGVEEGGPLQLTPLDTDNINLSPRSSSSSEGLRRRSPTRRDGEHHQFPTSSPSIGSVNNNASRIPDVPPPPSISRASLPISPSLQPRVHNNISPPPMFSLASSGGDGLVDMAGSSNSNRQQQNRSSGGGTTTGASSAPAQTLAQRAIQMQLRQHERFSPQGRRQQRRQPNEADGSDDDSDSTLSEDNRDDTDSSSDDDDDDDDHRNNSSNEGCSQGNLYIAMRLSFAVAIFHVFVLISLHATYVGPHAFHGQTQVVSLMQRARRLVKRADGFQNGIFSRGLVLSDDFEEGINDDSAGEKELTQTTLYNCISYALSTRPVQDRSTYFGEEKKDEAASDGTKNDSVSRNMGYDEEQYVLTPSESMNDEEDLNGDDGGYFHESYDRISQHGTKNASTAIGQSEKIDDMDDDDRYVHDDDDENNRYANQSLQRAMPEGGSNTSGDSKTPSSLSLPKEKKNVPLFGKDEILQIKILYGGKCTGRCSRVRKVVYPAKSAEDDEGSNSTETENERRFLHPLVGTQKNLRGQQQTEQQHQNRKTVEREMEEDDDGKDAKVVDELSTPSYWEKVHYRFAIDDALMFLDEKSALMHNITVVNVTVTERCLSTGSDDGRLSFLTAIGEFLSQMYGMDSIIINQLMYGIRGTDGALTSGYVKSMETQERWGWHKEQLETFEHNSFLEWVGKKLGILFMSSLAFFLITSVTSLIVRVLTSSGVVLMFPLFSCLRVMGMPGADERILALSYPWIGSARVAIANENVHPQSHLVWANVTKILLYYVMYEACQAAWSVVLYAKSIPEALPVWIYGFAMIWEYFSMVFVRSALSVHFFPRVAFLYFLLYHIYFYSVPYGYFDVALIPLFAFMAHAMLYTILGLEAPNSARGVINVECPREVYNRLSWPEPVAALPAEWTMFLPLNSRLSPLHDREISNGAGAEPNNDGPAGSDANDNIAT